MMGALATVLMSVISMLMNSVAVIIECLLKYILKLGHALLMFLAQEIMSQFKIDAGIFDSQLMGGVISTYGGAFRALGLSVLVLIAAWQIFKGFFSFMIVFELN